MNQKISALVLLSFSWSVGANRLIEQFKAEKERGLGVRQIELVQGLSHTLKIPQGIGPIHQTEAKFFDFRRIQRNGKVQELLLIPREVGTTDMTVFDGTGKPQTKYYVHVISREDQSAAARQLASEKKSGAPIREVELAQGVSQTLSFEKDIGPIYLTDSKLVDFRRIKQEQSTKQLLVLPKAVGYTDMTVHDQNGEVMSRLYVRISPAP